MKKILNIIDTVFILILITSISTMIIVIIYTFIDLHNNSFLICPSKDSIMYFFKSFAWCKSILGSVFALFTLFYTFQTFKIHNENKLFNSYIAPKGEKIHRNLNKIKTKNKQLYSFISTNHREIIKKIIFTEETVNNKKKLRKYFDKYVKNEIKKIEHSGYFGINCNGNCSTCTNKGKTITYNTNQFDNFRLFAFDLFCISIEYSDFEEDIKEIYEQNTLK
jgi:hypothetical protein